MSYGIMKAFVGGLLSGANTETIGQLTQRIIREKYLEHIGQGSLSAKEKDTMRDIVVLTLKHVNGTDTEGKENKNVDLADSSDDGSHSIDYDQLPPTKITRLKRERGEKRKGAHCDGEVSMEGRKRRKLSDGSGGQCVTDRNGDTPSDSDTSDEDGSRGDDNSDSSDITYTVKWESRPSKVQRKAMKVKAKKSPIDTKINVQTSKSKRKKTMIYSSDSDSDCMSKCTVNDMIDTESLSPPPRLVDQSDSDSSLPSIHPVISCRRNSDTDMSMKENVTSPILDGKHHKPDHKPAVLTNSSESRCPTGVGSVSVLLHRIDPCIIEEYKHVKKEDSSDDDVKVIIRSKKMKKKSQSKTTCQPSLPEDKIPKKSKPKKSSSKEIQLSSEESRLLMYQRIARECAVMPRGQCYKKMFHGKTNEEKIEVVLQLLKDAGMRGPPTMKKAKELKLKKELDSLGDVDIITMDGRATRSARPKEEYSLW